MAGIIVSLVGRSGKYSPGYIGTLGAYTRHVNSTSVEEREIELGQEKFEIEEIVRNLKNGNYVVIDAGSVGEEGVKRLEEALDLEVKEGRLTIGERNRLQVWCRRNRD